MGASKSDQFTTEQNLLAQLAKALGHPARVAILQHLIQINSCVCGDLVDELPLSQSTVSQHLKELKKSGLIKGTIEGTSVCYCIDREMWQQGRDMINRMFDSLNMERCC